MNNCAKLLGDVSQMMPSATHIQIITVQAVCAKSTLLMSRPLWQIHNLIKTIFVWLYPDGIAIYGDNGSPIQPDCCNNDNKLRTACAKPARVCKASTQIRIRWYSCSDMFAAIVGHIQCAIVLACISRVYLQQSYFVLSAVHDDWLSWTSDVHFLQFVSWINCCLVSSRKTSHCGQCTHVGCCWGHRNEVDIICYCWLSRTFGTEMQMSSFAACLQGHWCEDWRLCISRNLADVVWREAFNAKTCLIHDTGIEIRRSTTVCVCCVLLMSELCASCWCTITCLWTMLHVISPKLHQEL